jgi:hypothetical protein
MANFNTHFGVGATACSIISGVLLSMEVIAPSEAVIAFAIGTFGSLMPDVDSDNSKAIGIGFTVISLLITILFVFAKAMTYSIIEMLIMGGVVFYTVRFGFIGVFRKISRHRGIFHSIPMALIWGVSTSVIAHTFFGLNSLVAWVYGFMMSFGYMVHLILDEAYSVDLGNRRVKKSAGTAFKLFKIKNSRDAIKYIFVYFVLIAILMFAPDTSMIKDALFSHNAWLNFKDVLLPYDGRWFIH